MSRATGVSLDIALLMQRLVFGGFMFFGHGLGKLRLIGTDAASKFADPLGMGATLSQAMAALAEGVAAMLVILGVATRFSAAAVVFTMLVAGLIVHGPDPLFPKKELALLYAAGFALLMFTGGGRFSVDAWLRSRRG